MSALLVWFTALIGAWPAATTAAADPATTAVDISVMESKGWYSQIYDQMHPDARAIIPRDVVVGWYEHDFAPLGPGVISVTGVQYVTWTWPVTGKSYPNTAEVSFTQPFANGSVVTEVVRLVESGGQWRWFFGRSRAFVDDQITKYGGDPETPPVQQAGDVCSSYLVPIIQQSGLDPQQTAPVFGCESSTSGWRMRIVGEIKADAFNLDTEAEQWALQF